MKITVESTSQIVKVESNGGSVQGRVWEGRTAKGVYIQCVITHIAALADSDCSELEAELVEMLDPRREPIVDVFPLRMVV